MSAFENDEVLFPFAFFKWTHVYNLIDPNDNRILNYHIHRLVVVLMVVAVQFIFFFGTIGIFLKMEDTVDATANIMILAVFISNLVGVLKISVIIINAKRIWNLLDVTQVQFLKSQHCRKNRRKLEELKNKFSSIFKYVIGFFSMTFILWISYPLIANIYIKNNGNGNERYQNIFNLRYPVDIKTYNQYFWGFFFMEIVIILQIIIYALLDIFIVSICIVTIFQYEILKEAFASIEIKYESDKKKNEERSIEIFDGFKSILIDQRELYFTVRPIILSNVILYSAITVLLTYTFIAILNSTETVSLYGLIKIVFGITSFGFQTLTNCYVFELLATKREDVNYRIYCCDWTAMNLRYKKLMILTMRMNDAIKMTIRATPVMKVSYNILMFMLNTVNQTE